MNKKLKIKIGILMIAFSIISTTFAMPIYANEYSYSDNKENYQINVINENAVTVSSKDGIERIIVTENDTNRKVSVQNMDTGEQNYFVLNKEENTMYSSITGKKTYIENQELRAKQSSNTSYRTVYISYAELRNNIGETATVGGVVGLVMAKIPGTQFIGGAIGTISTIIGGGSLFIPNDSRHGLKFRIKTVKHYRYRMGKRRVYKTDNFVTSVARY